MRLVTLGPNDYREMPWKNGGGSTTELLIEPPGATLASGFLWRLSMAAVTDSGPFSSFPGIDRTLLLLEGKGMDLDYGPHGRARLQGPLEPVAFSGDWATSGQLLDGPCRDFNVMSERSAMGHDVVVMRPGSTPSPLPEATTVLVFCVKGQARVGAMDDSRDLHPGELVRIDREGAAAPGVVAVQSETVLLVVALQSR